MGIPLTPEEQFEISGDDLNEYEEEAEQSWGDTDAWQESERRSATYAKQDRTSI